MSPTEDAFRRTLLLEQFGGTVPQYQPSEGEKRAGRQRVREVEYFALVDDGLVSRRLRVVS